MNGNSQNVLHLFERQVERNPGAIAVTCGPRKLTYGELNQLAVAIKMKPVCGRARPPHRGPNCSIP